MIRQVEAELAILSVGAEWVDQAAFLVQLPGIGLVNAMTILAAVGEIERFPSAKHLVGYSGMGARVRASGTTHRSGGITKQGRAELRTAMVEAAWTAVGTNAVWKARFEQLADRIGRRKAIVAIARKLPVVVWNVLERERRGSARMRRRSRPQLHGLGHQPRTGDVAWLVPTGVRQTRAGPPRSRRRADHVPIRRQMVPAPVIRSCSLEPRPGSRGRFSPEWRRSVGAEFRIFERSDLPESWVLSAASAVGRNRDSFLPLRVGAGG